MLNNFPIDRLLLTSSIGYNLLRFSAIINLIDKISLSDKWLKRLNKWICVIDIKDNQSLNENTLNKHITLNHKKKILLIRAWDIHCPVLVKKYQNEIREIFTPKPIFTENAQLEVAKLREKYDYVVGVHARRGDYKEYLGGFHFHSWDSYRNWVIQTKGLMEDDDQKKIGFLLCSDDDPPSAVFENLPVHFMKKKSVMGDLHALSLCDYNIGPPSSFGTWVSWHGKVPRLHLEKDTKIRSLDQFSICSEC